MYIGIDKTKVKAFKVISIDIQRLKSSKRAIYKEDLFGIAIKTEKGEMISFDYLKITDGYIFNSLILGVKRNKGAINPYSFIEIHISDTDDRNLKPLTIEQYHKHIEKLKVYIEDEYGLVIDFTEAKFEQIEVNFTSKMDLKFEEYEYLLTQMILLVPKRYSLSSYVDKKRRINQFNFFNKSVQAKIYDKTKQLKDAYGITLNDHYMRIEYTLNKPNKIKATLKSEYIYKVKDNDIKEWITGQIYKDLISPIQKQIKKASKLLIELAKEEINIDSRKWTRNFLNRAMALKEELTNGKLHVVTDIKQVMDTIEKLTSKSNKKRTSNRLISAFLKYPFAKGNLDKLDEIIAKFT